MDAHLGLAVGGGDEAVLDGERPDAREHVAAVRAHVHDRLVHHDLREEVVDVAVLPGRGADDGDLARERVRSAETVDLAVVGRAHDREQHLVARLRIARQVGREEVRPP